MKEVQIGEFYLIENDGWSVVLPHQCDMWAITGGDYYGVSHEVAVREMTEFVNNAIEALRILKEKE